MNIGHYENFKVDCSPRGVVTLSLDVPGRPLNVLTEDVMRELESIVGELERASGIRAVVIQSSKESGFLAGADVHTIAEIASAEQAAELIDAGHRLFARIEALPMPTIVVIHGVCLGGGLELSLACNYRIARNNSYTQIGLPEIKLGLIPGWGGTQRLPRLIGLSSALEMILQGELVDANKALRLGLVDKAISPDEWDAGVDSFVDQVVAGERTSHDTCFHPLWRRWLDQTSIGRWLIIRMVRRRLAKKIQHYPAIDSALIAVSQGYEAERTEFPKLLQTPTCRNLIDLFMARESARQIKTWVKDPAIVIQTKPIRAVGVIGAGAMGAGIGQLAAYRGFDVVIKEIDEATKEAGRKRIAGLVDELAKRKRFSDEERSSLEQRISFTCDDTALHDVDLVIEAVVERDDVKRKVFRSLDSTLNQKAILASNTSALSVDRLASATGRPHQVAGLHFFNPVHRMELVEVVRAPETDERTIASLVTFVRALGKTPIVTTDSPGFIVNRVLFPYLGEAVQMVLESHAPDTIDKEIRAFGMPMGPLELLDQVGIDVAYHVATSLATVLPEAERVMNALECMVTQGHLGKKSGRGFYLYQHGKKGRLASLGYLPLISGSACLNKQFAPDGMSPIQRRLIYPMLIESARCLEEQVVDDAWAIDLAMVLGTGFAPHLGGPLHVIENIGTETIVTNLEALQACFGDRFISPKNLVELSRSGRSVVIASSSLNRVIHHES